MATNKPNVKKAPPKKITKQNLAHDFSNLADDLKRQVLGWLRELEKIRDIEKNNYELGQRHLALGNLSDAILRFRFVTWLNPKRADAWYYLGCSYMANKKKKPAKEALEKSLKLKPDNDEAIYMLALASGKSLPSAMMPKKMPVTLAREYFDTQADSYDREQVDVQMYQGHQLLCNAIRSQLVPGRIDHVILELGVGTGLCGPLLRDTAVHITGVDISERMLENAVKLQDAKGVKIYDALINRDVSEFLKDAPADGYDIVMAATVFSYIGDIKDIFVQAGRVLKAGGIFAFTADKKDGEGYDFDAENARFRFASAYLEKLAAESGLKTLKCVSADIYPEYPAWLCLFKK